MQISSQSHSNPINSQQVLRIQNLLKKQENPDNFNRVEVIVTGRKEQNLQRAYTTNRNSDDQAIQLQTQRQNEQYEKIERTFIDPISLPLYQPYQVNKFNFKGKPIGNEEVKDRVVANAFEFLQQLAKFPRRNKLTDVTQIEQKPQPINDADKNRINDFPKNSEPHTDLLQQNQQQKQSQIKRVENSKKSSFQLCYLKMCKQTSKFQSVQSLFDNTNQWAFDSKLSNFKDEEEFQNSFIQYQKKGLSTLAQNLNSLNAELEKNSRLYLDQNYSKSLNRVQTIKNPKPLELKIQLCKRESSGNEFLFDDITADQLEVKQYASQILKSKTEKPSTLQDNEQNNSSFSDALSNASRKGCGDNKSINLGSTSIKGLYKNIRKLTEDILEENDNNSMQEGIFGRLDAQSYTFHQKFQSKKNLKKSIGEASSSYSTSGRSPDKQNMQFNKPKFCDNVYKNYKSTDGHSFMPICSNSPAKTINSQHLMHYYYNKYSPLKIVQQQNRDLNTQPFPNDFQDCQVLNDEFNFETKDSFILEKDEISIDEESKGTPAGKRKLTHDDTYKAQSFLEDFAKHHSKNHYDVSRRNRK